MSHKEISQQKTFELLKERRLEEAFRILAEFEACEPVPRGIGIDWATHDGTQDIEILRVMSNAAPAILRDISTGDMDQLRLAAMMIHMWGEKNPYKWLPSSFSYDSKLKPDVVCRMISFYAHHQISIRDFKRIGFEEVEILGCGTGCTHCQSINGQRFKLQDVPELPFAYCTDELGCRCLATPYSDDDPFR